MNEDGAQYSQTLYISTSKNSQSEHRDKLIMDV